MDYLRHYCGLVKDLVHSRQSINGSYNDNPSFHYTLNSNHREKETFLFVIAVQSPSCVQLFKMPWTAACQVSLSLIISWSGSLPFH